MEWKYKSLNSSKFTFLIAKRKKKDNNNIFWRIVYKNASINFKCPPRTYNFIKDLYHQVKEE